LQVQIHYLLLQQPVKQKNELLTIVGAIFYTMVRPVHNTFRNVW